MEGAGEDWKSAGLSPSLKTRSPDSRSRRATRPMGSSVDSGKPATDRQFKTGHHERAAETSLFYFVPFSARKSVCSFVRQLRGPHLSTCA